MVAAGLIKAPAYSLWLNDQSSSTGSILFGGVDSARYGGLLQTLDAILAPKAAYQFLQNQSQPCFHHQGEKDCEFDFRIFASTGSSRLRHRRFHPSSCHSPEYLHHCRSNLQLVAEGRHLPLQPCKERCNYQLPFRRLDYPCANTGIRASSFGSGFNAW